MPLIFRHRTEQGSKHYEAAGPISFYSKNQALALENLQQSLNRNEADNSDPYFPVPFFLAAIIENKKEAQKLIDTVIQIRVEAIEKRG